MLELTKTQSRILGVFVNNYDEYEGEFRRGFNSYMLQNQGIDTKTFRNNKQYLEDNYLIRLNYLGYHGHQSRGRKKDKSQRRKGQFWYYYKVTKLGLIAYLKWLNENPASQEVNLTPSSFPLLIRVMPKIFKKYGQIANYVLQNTADQISIIPKIEIKIKHSADSITHYSKTMMETLTIPMSSVTIQIKREIMPPKIISVDSSTSKYSTYDDDYTEKANNEIDNSIEERFTFLYLYNLINLGKDFREMINIFTLYQDKKLSYEELEKQLLSHINKMADNVPFVIKLIKSNKKLNKIFQEMTAEINEKLDKSATLNILSTNFSS